MNATRRPAASPATETFDAETLALLDAVAVELPDFGDIDLDIAFGTPLAMYEAGLLPHEQVTATSDMGPTEFVDALITADTTRRARLHAARDITTADPAIPRFVRERLVDVLVLLPYATHLRITRRSAAAAPLPLVA
ncbi:hypothetical protein [Streptomyces sp. 35G-GA-8]|uniref:hypothetical protein n=1 Tax=Streptomyces sp. 35G-GA-8 TaxID=2939434 RepID=UPI00201EF83D|nr:hypothetical protein [Streptomyces sp. 35G-GA-8]MCL7382190.1 hypothetical protein [Streptomyces sp. 35G-GA-8]